MKNFVTSYILMFVVLVYLAQRSLAREFSVGEKDGWVLNPSESYDHWAERMRFQVNDTLVFKYDKGKDSVLVVSDKQKFDACVTIEPIEKLDGGESVFKFDRSGAFFFISGAPGMCEKGQKLYIIVMAVRNKNNNRATPPNEPLPAPAPFNNPSTSAPPPSPGAAASSSTMTLKVVGLTAAVVGFALLK